MDKRTNTTRHTVKTQWKKEQRPPATQRQHNGQKNKDHQTNSDNTMDKRARTTRQTVITKWTKNKDNQKNSDNTMDKRTKTTRQTVITQWTKEQRRNDNTMAKRKGQQDKQ